MSTATTYQGDENHVRSLRHLADRSDVPAHQRAAAAAQLERIDRISRTVDPVVPRWLDLVLAQAAVLDLNHPDARRELAAALIAAAGADAKASALMIAETIAGSAYAVLTQKISSTVNGKQVLIDAEYSKRVAREIGNNAAGTVVLVLAVGPDEE